MGITKDLLGERFGSLVVIQYVGLNYKLCSEWLCVCDCKKKVLVAGSLLINNNTKSCGCLLKNVLITRNTTHGMTNTSEHNTWRGIKGRCLNQNSHNYADYGGRGITVCERWINSFENFFEDMGLKPSSKHSIERIDNNKGYSKENCRWATDTEQCNNRRSSIKIEYNGETYTLRQWCQIKSLNYKNTWQRIKRDNWSPERAFATI